MSLVGGSVSGGDGAGLWWDVEGLWWGCGVSGGVWGSGEMLRDSDGGVWGLWWDGGSPAGCRGGVTTTPFSPQNRGIYMFRINNEHVIDATLTGGPAR